MIPLLTAIVLGLLAILLLAAVIGLALKLAVVAAGVALAVLAYFAAERLIGRGEGRRRIDG